MCLHQGEYDDMMPMPETLHIVRVSRLNTYYAWEHAFSEAFVSRIQASERWKELRKEFSERGELYCLDPEGDAEIWESWSEEEKKQTFMDEPRGDQDGDTAVEYEECELISEGVL